MSFNAKVKTGVGGLVLTWWVEGFEGWLELGAFISAWLVGLCLTGCGLVGGGGELEFEEIIFEDVPPTPTPLVEDVVASVGLDDALLVKLRFLYSHQVRLETLRRLGRDLQSLVEYEGDENVDLEWVIEVHEVTEDGDEFVKRATRAGIPESEREQYEFLFIGLLEGMDVVQYGSSRLLKAATIVGPSGRSLETVESADKEQFLIFMREAAYFLEQADEMITEEVKSTNNAIGRVGLRR